jgi:hypothetical protein
MMPTIRVDDDVYEYLQREAKPFVDSPNSVLRRVLGLDSFEATALAPHSTETRGELWPLIQAELLEVGEELIWKRRQSTYTATVTSNGCLRLSDGRVFATPSGAARTLSGYEVNGWRSWGRARNSVRLSSLRDQLS